MAGKNKHFRLVVTFFMLFQLGIFLPLQPLIANATQDNGQTAPQNTTSTANNTGDSLVAGFNLSAGATVSTPVTQIQLSSTTQTMASNVFITSGSSNQTTVSAINLNTSTLSVSASGPVAVVSASSTASQTAGSNLVNLQLNSKVVNSSTQVSDVIKIEAGSLSTSTSVIVVNPKNIATSTTVSSTVKIDNNVTSTTAASVIAKEKIKDEKKADKKEVKEERNDSKANYQESIIEINKKPKKILSETIDQVDLGNGKFAYKIFQSPRFLERLPDGSFKERPRGWNLFKQTEKMSLKKNTTMSGYWYQVPLDSKNDISIFSGNLEVANSQQVYSPSKSNLIQTTEGFNDVSIYQEVYPGVDIKFKDEQQYRYKDIIIKNKPNDLQPDDNIIFWEEYNLPVGAEVVGGDKKAIEGTKELNGESVYIGLNDNYLAVGSAVVYDSAGLGSDYKDKVAQNLTQIVSVDKQNNKLRIGVKIDTNYLLNNKIVYPVIVDPVYRPCYNFAFCKLTKFYVRAVNGAAQNPANTISNELFVGHQNDAGTHYTRSAVYYFNENFTKFVNIQYAYLYGYYRNIGFGAYNGNVNIAARRITRWWGQMDPILNPNSWWNTDNPTVDNSLDYPFFRGSLASENIATAINTGSFPGHKWFDVTNSVINWSNRVPNYGLLLEYDPAWPNGNNPVNWPDRLMKFDASGTYADANGDVYSTTPFIYIMADMVAPDLADNGSEAPVTVAAGSNLNINYKFINQGNANIARGPIVYYYLNPKADCYGTAHWVGSFSVSALNAGATFSLNDSYKIPANTAPGAYCFFYRINPLYEIDEARFDNNNYYFNINVTAQAKPDLTKSAQQSSKLPKNTYYQGENISDITVSVVNAGGAQSGNTSVNFLFNKDNPSYITNLIQNKALAAINPGSAASTQAFFYTVPANAVPGSYYVSYDIDPQNFVDESNNGNNQFSFDAITVAAPPELVISTITIPDARARYVDTNDTIAVSARIKNTSQSAANGVTYQLGLKDEVSGIIYATVNNNPAAINLAGGSDQILNLSATIPANTPFNTTYKVEVVLNPIGVIPELDRTNNTATSLNAILMSKFNLGGGGGANPDSDKDGYKDIEEVEAGTNPASDLGLKPYDLNYKKYKSVASDSVKPPSAPAKKTTPTAAMPVNHGGDPVNIRTGVFEFNQTDFTLPGRGLPINLTRTYNNKTTDINSRFGRAWDFSYNIFYYLDAASKNILVYVGGNLAGYFTTADGGATYVASKGDDSILYKDVATSKMVFKTMDGVKYVFSNTLTSNMALAEQIIDAAGNKTTLAYKPARDVPLLASVTSPDGKRGITFTYPASDDANWDKISKLTYSNGDVITVDYTYDAGGNLTKTHSSRTYGGKTEYIDHTYVYDVKNRLSEYTDANNTILYNYYDDATNRVIRQEEYNPRVDAPGAKRKIYEFIYNDVGDPNVAGSAHCVTVNNYRDANNYYSEYSCFNADELKIYSKKGDVIERWVYNALGLVSEYNNGAGKITKYDYDASRRLVKETAPDTAWHTEIIYEYENNFNRVTTSTQTATLLANPATKLIKKYLYKINSFGQIATSTDPLGKKEEFYYGAYGRVRMSINKKGMVAEYGYDLDGNFIESTQTKATQADGSVQITGNQISHDPLGNIFKTIDGRNKSTGYKSDTLGNRREQTDTLGNKQYYTYDFEGHKVTETNELSQVTTYTYDTDINASLLSIKKVGPDGNIINSREYDYVGNLVKEKDPLKRETSYTYDSANRVYQKIDPLNTVTYSYNGLGQILSAANSAGQKTEYIYDSRGNKTEEKKYLDNINFVSSKWEYDGFNRPVKFTDGNGKVTSYEYDLMDKVVKITDAKNGVTEFGYDDAGNKIGERLPMATADANLRNASGYSNSFVYDGLNRLIKQTNANDKTTLNFYDENNNLVKVVSNQDADGKNNTHITQFVYDELNRKTKDVFADNSEVSYTYTKVGALETVKDQIGRVTTSTYDVVNRLTQVIAPGYSTTTYQYDLAGNKTLVTYADNSTVKYEYNEHNKVKTITDFANGVQEYLYDAVDNMVTSTNKLTNSTGFVYDKLNRLVREKSPEGTVTTYGYDKNGNKTSVTVGDKVTKFKYNELNKLETITYPGDKTETYGYNADGVKISYIDGNNKETKFVPDKLGRIVTKQLPSSNVGYVYDNWNNLTKLTDAEGVTDYTYDLLGNQLTETKNITALNKQYVITKNYYADNKLKDLTDAAGKKIDYTYNNSGLLKTAKLGAATLATYNYNILNNPTSVINGNGIATAYTYDTLNRPASIITVSSTGAVYFGQKYKYDAEGNRQEMLNYSVATGQYVATTYQYNKDNALTAVDYKEVNGVGNDLVYNYDANGNRLDFSSPLGFAATSTYANNSNELLKTVYNDNLTVDSLYDGNGSLTKETYTQLGIKDKEVTYTWNEENRLAKYEVAIFAQTPGVDIPANPNNVVTYSYDDFGNRVSKTSDFGLPTSDTTFYINNGLTVLNELDNDGNVTKSIIQGLSTIGEIDSNGIITYIHQDSLGSTALATDSNGGIAQQYEYEPFGQIIGAVYVPGQESKYLFTGQEFDPESELYYYNARYYNPALGRFISRDPVLGESGNYLSYNNYIYALNNPLRYVDPDGQEAKKIIDFINSDGFQLPLGFGAQFSDAAWNTLEGASNLFWHPIDSLKNAVNGISNFYQNAFEDAKSLYNEGWANISADLKSESQQMYINYKNLSAYDKGRLFGYATEKVAETFLMVKGLSALKGAAVADLDGAVFAQRTYSNAFSVEGVQIYTGKVGTAINTVDDLTAALKANKITPSQLPIDYIVRDGNKIMLNTRTAQALERAGVPRSQWTGANQTGVQFYEGLLDGQLQRNGLSNSGFKNPLNN